MKNSRIVVVAFAFIFAIASAFASSTVVSSYETGVIEEGNCASPQSLGKTCYSPGTGTQCEISSQPAFVPEMGCTAALWDTEP